jgi:hypothetical protein
MANPVSTSPPSSLELLQHPAIQDGEAIFVYYSCNYGLLKPRIVNCRAGLRTLPDCR